MANQDPPPTNTQQVHALTTQKDILAAMGRIDRQIIALLNALEKWVGAGKEAEPTMYAPERFAEVKACAQRLHELTGGLEQTCVWHSTDAQEGGDV